MLCDDLLHTLKGSLGHSPDDESRKANLNIAHALERAQRFVLSPLVVETATQLAVPANIDRTRDHLFTPARLTWLEWAGLTPGGYGGSNRHGMLLIGSEQIGCQIRLGWGVYCWDSSTPAIRRRVWPLAMTYDFPAPDRPILRWIMTPMEMLQTKTGKDFPAEHLLAMSVRDLGAFVGAALAVINTPRLSYVIDHEQKEVNASRQRRGAPPYLSWREVRIAIDRGELGLSHKRPRSEGRALHHVRAFLRIVRGKVQLVSPHWRGNPRFGVIMHRYVAFRAEDEAGPWKGGPLPGPALINELAEPDETDSKKWVN